MLHCLWKWIYQVSVFWKWKRLLIESLLMTGRYRSQTSAFGQFQSVSKGSSRPLTDYQRHQYRGLSQWVAAVLQPQGFRHDDRALRFVKLIPDFYKAKRSIKAFCGD